MLAQRLLNVCLAVLTVRDQSGLYVLDWRSPEIFIEACTPRGLDPDATFHVPQPENNSNIRMLFSF